MSEKKYKPTYAATKEKLHQLYLKHTRESFGVVLEHIAELINVQPFADSSIKFKNLSKVGPAEIKETIDGQTYHKKYRCLQAQGSSSGLKIEVKPIACVRGQRNLSVLKLLIVERQSGGMGLYKDDDVDYEYIREYKNGLMTNPCVVELPEGRTQPTEAEVDQIERFVFSTIDEYLDKNPCIRETYRLHREEALRGTRPHPVGSHPSIPPRTSPGRLSWKDRSHKPNAPLQPI